MSVGVHVPLKNSEILKQAHQDCLELDKLIEIAWAEEDAKHSRLVSLEVKAAQLEQQLEKLNFKRDGLQETWSLHAYAGDTGAMHQCETLLTRLMDYRTNVYCDLAEAMVETHDALEGYREVFVKSAYYLRQLNRAEQRLQEVIRTTACPCE
jgi:hypothetical protein